MLVLAVGRHVETIVLSSNSKVHELVSARQQISWTKQDQHMFEICTELYSTPQRKNLGLMLLSQY